MHPPQTPVQHSCTPTRLVPAPHCLSLPPIAPQPRAYPLRPLGVRWTQWPPPPRDPPTPRGLSPRPPHALGLYFGGGGGTRGRSRCRRWGAVQARATALSPRRDAATPDGASFWVKKRFGRRGWGMGGGGVHSPFVPLSGRPRRDGL